MPAYTSAQLTNNGNSVSQGAFPGNMVCYFAEVVITANAANLDTFNFFRVPKGFRVLGGSLESTDIDTNGSPTVTLNIGDAGSANRFFAAATVGQTGTASTALAVTGLHHLYTEDTTITGAIPTGPATGTTGTISLALWGRFEGSAS